MMNRMVMVVLISLSLSPLFSQNRSFHFFGWSDQGHFAWYEQGQDDRGPFFFFQIVDLVSDEAIVEELVYSSNRDGQSITNEIRRRYSGSLGEYKIQSSSMGQTMDGERFDYMGASYRIMVIQESDNSTLRILNSSSNSYKNISGLSGSNSQNWQLLGGLISPFEKRAAVVVLDRQRGTHMVFGSHLTLGFQRLENRAGDLVEAVLCGQYYICRMLLNQGVSIEEADSRGYTALLLAARNGKWDIAALLLAHGADVSVMDDRGNRALHYAVMAGELQLARGLCEQGSSPQWRNNQNRSAMDLARGNGAMESLLRSF